MEKTAKNKNSLIQLENLNAEMLPELQGWKEKQNQIVEDNPFIEITDNKSYEIAKKRRTVLVTARTDVEKQDKLIASKLRDFRAKVSEVSKELISITKPHETAQQEEVKKYEAVKEAERKEKERIEQKRKDDIKDRIENIYNKWKDAIEKLTFNDIEGFEMSANFNELDTSQFEEFTTIFEAKRNILNSQFEEKVKYLNEKEEARIEREKLEKERKAFELEQKKAKEIAAKKQAELEKKEREEKAKRDAEAEKLRKEREELEAEKRRIAEIEAKKQAELEEQKRKEQEAKEKAIAKKRAEALKPDVEKLKTVINAIGIHTEAPELKDNVSKTFFTELKLDIEDLKKELHSKLSNLK